MSKNKSINELLSSIVSLINEAKNEYEFVINKKFTKEQLSRNRKNSDRRYCRSR